MPDSEPPGSGERHFSQVPRPPDRDAGREPLIVVLDPDDASRSVALWPTDWAYIVGKPARGISLAEVEAVIRGPDLRVVDPNPRRERFYKRAIGPSAWLRVVVDWTGSEGRVYNAIPMGSLPVRDRPQP
jgi:hypothetical protein